MRGVERPGILANIPVKDGYVALIDVGANAECRPSHLQQFAVMGSVFARTMWGVASPSVGLMSIGEEPEKGSELVVRAHALLRETSGVRFYGNVEGRDLFRGLTDVVVTDGFTGNVILKLAEGEARELFSWVRDALRADLRSRIGGMLVRPRLRSIAARLDPAEYGAQPLLGRRRPRLHRARQRRRPRRGERAAHGPSGGRGPAGRAHPQRDRGSGRAQPAGLRPAPAGAVAGFTASSTWRAPIARS